MLSTPRSGWSTPAAIDTGDFVFLSGIIGVRADGGLSSGPERHFPDAYDIVGQHLVEAGLGFDDIVEMTS